MKRITITTICLFCSLSFLNGQNNSNKEKENIIRQRIEQFVIDVNNSNAEGFADTFSDKLYSQDTKTGIKSSIEKRGKLFDIKYTIHIKEIKVDNKMAYEEGWFRSELTPKKGGKTIIQEFDFLDVWELEKDNKWRIIKALKVERLIQEYKNISELTGEFPLIVGTFKSKKITVDIKVTNTNDLVLIVNGGAPIKLKKTSKLAYNLEGVPGAELSFELDNNGVANKAIMNQASGKVIANRMYITK